MDLVARDDLDSRLRVCDDDLESRGGDLHCCPISLAMGTAEAWSEEGEGNVVIVMTLRSRAMRCRQCDRLQ